MHAFGPVSSFKKAGEILPSLLNLHLEAVVLFLPPETIIFIWSVKLLF